MTALVQGGGAHNHQFVLLQGRGVRRQLRPSGTTLPLPDLPPHHQELLMMLTADPQIPYQEISRRLGIPTGSIGPTRSRCLRKLRDTSQVQALLAS